MNYVAYRILFLASQIRIYSVPVTWNLVWHGLIKSHFVWDHNLAWTHLNRTKCLNVTISNQPMWIEPNSSLPMCVTACRLIGLLLVLVFSHLVFPQFLSREADMIVSYRVSYLATWNVVMHG